jgi:hypothetical protein
MARRVASARWSCNHRTALKVRQQCAQWRENEGEHAQALPEMGAEVVVGNLLDLDSMHRNDRRRIGFPFAPADKKIDRYYRTIVSTPGFWLNHSQRQV